MRWGVARSRRDRQVGDEKRTRRTRKLRCRGVGPRRYPTPAPPKARKSENSDDEKKSSKKKSKKKRHKGWADELEDILEDVLDFDDVLEDILDFD